MWWQLVHSEQLRLLIQYMSTKLGKMNASSSLSCQTKLGGTGCRENDTYHTTEGEWECRGYKEVKVKMWVLVLISKVWNVNNSARSYIAYFFVFPYLAAHFTHVPVQKNHCYSCLHLLHVIQAESSWNCFLGKILHCDKACGEGFERPSVSDQHSCSGSCQWSFSSKQNLAHWRDPPRCICYQDPQDWESWYHRSRYDTVINIYY